MRRIYSRWYIVCGVIPMVPPDGTYKYAEGQVTELAVIMCMRTLTRCPSTPTPMAVGQIKVPPESYGAFWPSTSISQRNPSNMPDQRQNLSRGHFARNALREKYAPQHILSIRCSPYRRSTPTITVPYLVLFEAIKTGDGLCRQQFEVQGSYGIQGS